MMADSLCGFCHRGTEVSDACGYLFISEAAIAHRKCMQYSADLMQYHHNIGFGGFKLEKVTAEINRGSKLKCSVCYSQGHRRKKTTKRVGGATSGCAWPRCSKTFHFYCAFKNKDTITRRMEVVSKRKKSHKFVEYRVFCSEKHEEAYIDSKAKEHQRVRRPSEISGSSGEELDKTAPSINAPDLDEDFETDSSSDDAENVVSSTVKSKNKASTSARNGTKRSAQESTETDSESKTEKKPSRASVKKKRHKASPTTSENDTAKSQDGESNNVGNTIGTINPIKIEINPRTDCLLCFVELEEVAPDLEKKLKRFINKVYNIPGTSVCTWNCPDFELSSEHIVYLLKDLTMALRHQQYDEFQRLVTNLHAEDIGKYSYTIEMNRDFPDELSKTVYSKLRDSIKDNLRVASEFQQKMCGFYCRVQHKQHQIRVAFLTLNDGTDPGERIRKTILNRIEIHEWDGRTRAQAPGVEMTKESKDAEHDALRQWLLMVEGSFVDARPWDPVMVGDQRGSVTVRLLKHFQTSTSYTDMSHRIIFIRPLDGSIIVYSSYLRKLLSGLFQDESEESVIVVFDLQPDLESVADILRGLPRNVIGKVLSAFNPTEQPISCIILKLDKSLITDDTVSSTTAGKAAVAGSDQDVAMEHTDGDISDNDGIDMCEIIREDPPTESIDFTPPDLKWRLLQCNSLGLKMTSICSPNTILETRTIGIPSLTHKIKGDGNCFFRALSQEITGSQNQHLAVRRKLINYMIKRPKVFNRFFNMKDVGHYIEDSEMGEDGIWATDTEIIAMATMLETNIVIFTKVGTAWKWLPYNPVDGATNHNCQVYLVNKGHHYDLVLNVQAINK